MTTTLSDVAPNLWRGHPDSFPRDVEAAVLTALPVCVVRVGQLSLEVVQEELERRRIRVACGIPDRPLRGCLVARSDVGFIFVDSTDSIEEQRFTVAHEAAHYLVDYSIPRTQALKHFGEPIREVLDGKRLPSAEERIDGFLARVPLGAHVHIMSRNPDGYDGACEVRADALAYEILAPSRSVRQTLIDRHPNGDRREAAAQILITEYGFPEAPARDYAAMLYQRTPLVPLKTLLGL
jgi:hypothetical protein